MYFSLPSEAAEALPARLRMPAVMLAQSFVLVFIDSVLGFLFCRISAARGEGRDEDRFNLRWTLMIADEEGDWSVRCENSLYLLSLEICVFLR